MSKVEVRMEDYIRLGLAVKTTWPQIDFETVEIHEVPFGNSRVELPLLVDTDWKEHPIEPMSQFEQESVEMYRLRGKQAEFMAGYAPVSNKLLIGIKG